MPAAAASLSEMKLLVLLSGYVSPMLSDLKQLFDSEKPNCDGSALDESIIECTSVDANRYPTLDGSCNNQIDRRHGKAFIPLKVF